MFKPETPTVLVWCSILLTQLIPEGWDRKRQLRKVEGHYPGSESWPQDRPDLLTPYSPRTEKLGDSIYLLFLLMSKVNH